MPIQHYGSLTFGGIQQSLHSRAGIGAGNHGKIARQSFSIERHWIVRRHSFLKGVLQSELDLTVVRSSVGDGSATWHVDGDLRTASW
jgi:hypothetical protein